MYVAKWLKTLLIPVHSQGSECHACGRLAEDSPVVTHLKGKAMPDNMICARASHLLADKQVVVARISLLCALQFSLWRNPDSGNWWH